MKLLSKSKSMKINLSKYTKEDLAIGILIGFQCILAFSVIVYHLV